MISYRDIAVVILNTALLLGGIEGAGRTYERWRPASPIQFDYAPYRMVKMTRAPWALNRDGFRASEWDAYEGHFVVEFLGGSACLGVGRNTGPTVPERLQEALWNDGLSEARVVNLCQGGATSGQELAIFVQYGLPLHPEVVLSYNGANDVLHPSPIGEDAAANLPYLDAAMRGHSLFSHFSVARLVGRKLPHTAVSPVEESDVHTAYLQNLRSVRALAGGSLHAVLLQPVSDSVRERYARARDAVVHSGLHVYDLTSVRGPFTDHVHFDGRLGYEEVFRELETQGLVHDIEARYRMCRR